MRSQRSVETQVQSQCRPFGIHGIQNSNVTEFAQVLSFSAGSIPPVLHIHSESRIMDGAGPGDVIK
jgi:hypothetical protein